MKKPRLSVFEQIEHMKSQGIQFYCMNEVDAAKYLEENTYYFKIKAYAKLFDKYSKPEKNNQYINLDFAYLVDLSKIDAGLRRIIMKLSLDIEHYLKVVLIRDFNKTDEDGYEIVSKFISFNKEHYEKEFRDKRDGKACSNLVNKYEGEFALWNIIEVLSLRDFHELYNYFYSRHGIEIYGKIESPYSHFIPPMRILRNAAAHNNCLINSLRTPYITQRQFNNNPQVAAFLGNYINNKTLNTNLSKPLIHDFCVMLYLYCMIAPRNARTHMIGEIKDFIDVRVIRHKEFYEKNSTLVSAYNFLKNVINVFNSY